MNENRHQQQNRLKAKPRKFTRVSQCVARLVLPDDASFALQILGRNGWSYAPSGILITKFEQEFHMLADATVLADDRRSRVPSDHPESVWCRVLRQRYGSLTNFVRRQLGLLQAEGLVEIASRHTQAWDETTRTFEAIEAPTVRALQPEEWPERHLLAGLALRLE